MKEEEAKTRIDRRDTPWPDSENACKSTSTGTNSAVFHVVFRILNTTETTTHLCQRREGEVADQDNTQKGLLEKSVSVISNMSSFVHPPPTTVLDYLESLHASVTKTLA